MTEAWVQRYGNVQTNAGAQAVKVVVDAAGDIIVTGSTGAGRHDIQSIKYSGADGAVLWQQRYNNPYLADTRPSALAVDGSGNVIVTGSSLLGAGYEMYTASGNVVVTGTSASFDSFSDYYTVKYAAADGALLWEKRFTGPAFTGVSSHYLALGPDGIVAVAGTAKGGYATVVYREVPEVVCINLVPTGVRLRFSGTFGRTYNIERAPAVTGPWSTLNTQIPAASGAFEYLDTNPPSAAAYYRTSAP